MSKLERPFGFWTATALVVGTMIGAGIFILPGQIAPLGWTGVAAWLLAGAGVMAIGRVVCELVIARPEEPSLMTTCGDILGLLPGRVLAWSYWVAVWCSVAVVAVTAASYLSRFIPALAASPLRLALGGSLIVALLSAVNLRGARSAGRVQVATTVLKLLPLVVVIAIVAILGLSAPETFAETPKAPFSAVQLTPALTIAFFAVLGFESASLVAERVRDPARNISRATLAGLAITIAIYLVVSTGIAFASPAGELAAAPAPIAYFVERHWSAWAGDAVALFAAISAIGCLNGLILLQGEVPLTMVRDGQLPAAMAPVNKHDVAAWPLLFASSLAIALMLGSASAIGARVLDFMLRLTTASTIWFYIGVCVAALMIGRMRVLAVAGIGFCLWLLYGAGLEAGGLGVLLMLVGVALHFVLGDRTKPRTLGA